MHARTPKTFAFLGFTTVVMLISVNVLAQNPQGSTSENPQTVTADGVAQAVQAFYDQTRTIQADFYQTHVNKVFNRTQRSHGRVVFAKPGKMRWDYQAPTGNVIVSDGRKITIYEPEGQQYFEQNVGDSDLTQALSFLTGSRRLADDFTFRLLDPASQGFAAGYVLELRPKRENPHYDRVLFYVDAGRARGVVHRVLIIDHAGNRNRFDFSHFQFNRSVAESTFRWTPPSGAHRVQR